MFEWFRSNDVLLGWLFAASALLFVGSLIAVPWLVIRIPSDYFMHRRRRFGEWRNAPHPIVGVAFFIAKNVFGVVLLLAGLAMLVLPGQGILTLLVGLMCVDFPGKAALEHRLVRERHVARVINWIRAKAHRPPLQLCESSAPSTLR